MATSAWQSTWPLALLIHNLRAARVGQACLVLGTLGRWPRDTGPGWRQTYVACVPSADAPRPAA